jgi:hypothetical protein
MTTIDLAAIQARINLAQNIARRIFGECPEPPVGIIDDDDSVHRDLIRWSIETGISLDWLFVGEPDPLIIAAMWARKAA